MDASYPAERGNRGRGSLGSRLTNSGNGSNNIVQSALVSTAKRSSSSPPLFRTVTWILIVLCASFLSFYVGVWTGIQAGGGPAGAGAAGTKLSPSNLNLSDEEIQRKVEALAKQKVKAQLDDLCKKLPSAPLKDTPGMRKATGVSQLFSKSIQHFAQGLVRVSNKDLMQTFDFGVPPNADNENFDSLILYSKKQALPSDDNVAKAARYEDPTKPLPFLSAKTATENCERLNVVLIDNPGNIKQCFALIGGQYQSHHIQHWMRRAERYGKMDPTQPLRLTSRAWTVSGRQEFFPPKQSDVAAHEKKLLTYLTESDNIKSRLKAVLANMDRKGVVIITCNKGQSELLMNFACSAHARGFDLKNVLVFPTDLETKELAEGIGLATFYEETLMASIPKKEAGVYGDLVFTAIMYAKVLCVQLVNELGYDLLFQDADIVWYKNPLEYFHDQSLPQFDTYFQDDGSRQERYAPYSANSGFYFVRSNPKTQHLFKHMVYQSDLIEAWNSHQQVLIALLVEHNSVMGLSVKIFPKEMEEFPGGLQFHRKKPAMKKIMSGESKAYIFHMSWTENKRDKLKFFQQMGEWYLNDQCIGKEANQIIDGSPSDGALVSKCCSAEPIITCHYRDKPSKIPCPDAPNIDKRGTSFW